MQAPGSARQVPAVRSSARLEADDEVEAASPPDFAFQPDPPVHQGRPAARQWPAPAPFRHAGGVVELSACSNISKIVARFSSGMPIPVSLTVKCRTTSCPRAGFLGNLQADLALIGELDGIAHQVHHDLAQAVIVADHHVRHVGMDEAGQFQTPLVRPDGERFHRVAQAFPQVERAVVEGQLPRFDLGEVEDVVDHREQGFARVPDGHEEFPLLGRQRALQDQFRHADDRVQRRADLVAHVGQERALGAAGGFRRLLGLFQFGVGASQVGRPLRTRISSSSCALRSCSSASRTLLLQGGFRARRKQRPRRPLPARPVPRDLRRSPWGSVTARTPWISPSCCTRTATASISRHLVAERARCGVTAFCSSAIAIPGPSRHC